MRASRRRLVLAAAALLGLLLVPNPANATTDELVITAPKAGAVLPEAKAVTVRGKGCPPAALVKVGVLVDDSGSPEPIGEGRADGRGRFAVDARIPEVSFGDTVPSFKLQVACGDRVASIPITIEDTSAKPPVNPAPPSTFPGQPTTSPGQQVSVVPAGGVETGAGGAAPSTPARWLPAVAVAGLAGLITTGGVLRRRTNSETRTRR